MGADRPQSSLGRRHAVIQGRVRRHMQTGEGVKFIEIGPGGVGAVEIAAYHQSAHRRRNGGQSSPLRDQDAIESQRRSLRAIIQINVVRRGGTAPLDEPRYW